MTPRPSHLDPYVPVSVHTAPDVLSNCFCSCGYSHDSFHEQLEGYWISSCCDCRQDDVNLLVHHRENVVRTVHIYGLDCGLP